MEIKKEFQEFEGRHWCYISGVRPGMVCTGFSAWSKEDAERKADEGVRKFKEQSQAE